MISTRFLGRSIGQRSFVTSPRSFFLKNIFGSKESKTKELIEKQDEYAVDPNSKILVLNEENSPSHKAFDPESDIPGFKISQWKEKLVLARDIEASVTKEMVADAINKAYQESHGSEISAESYATTSLGDLQKRFEFVKIVQQKLGFDIKDHTISRSHDVEYLYEALQKQIAHRWSSERNPNAIVLRPEDFKDQPNVYLNIEFSEKEQAEIFQDLKKQALENE
ncbi:hypothetical protein METBIDRAFT_47516 [Metschnikowia bicuspidata var. bicuspidata NRRL YB-4993]|uniref:Large ribosomal subunit protein mL50 n=1 Tax=Metschnikowia bicuspidata var. bicuspidata NRRL YB-4993 TaxID=869754 RepID=A0A1A0H5B7_9ASCO|nr:hypothetical protein METBIDRAFT_47516 [Metschnikowia bicuspidata var. bicuspidata NRRL YB-4993]OBA19102.1 hypothetical protein METBIDRAFT_47516 [Metschnikowia bicuspidata var. bicuspidata NRRL YB-4993]